MTVFRKDEQAVYFAHIPKTGGTTVERVFVSNEWEMAFFDGGKGKSYLNLLQNSPQHMDRKQYESIFKMSQFDFSFTCVRHPLARFKSEMVMRMRNRVKINNEKKNTEFAFKLIDDYIADANVFDGHLKPQVDYISRGMRVFKLEDGMSELIEQLNDNYKLSLAYDGVHYMSGKKLAGIKSSDIKISNSVIKAVQDLYREDYIMFSYEYDL